MKEGIHPRQAALRPSTQRRFGTERQITPIKAATTTPYTAAIVTVSHWARLTTGSTTGVNDAKVGEEVVSDDWMTDGAQKTISEVPPWRVSFELVRMGK